MRAAQGNDPAGSGRFHDLTQPSALRTTPATITRRVDAGGAAPADVGLSRWIADRCVGPPSLILILAAANDPILPIASARDLAARSAALGNRITLVVFRYAGHDFNAACEGIPNQTVRQMVGRFLAENDPGPAR
jgi:dienelactone hydrolase